MAAKISKVRFARSTEKYTGPPHVAGMVYGSYASWTRKNRPRVDVHVIAGGMESHLCGYYPEESNISERELGRRLIGLTAAQALKLIQSLAAKPAAEPPLSFEPARAPAEMRALKRKEEFDLCTGSGCWKFEQGYHQKPHQPHCAWLKTQTAEYVAREAARLAEGKACTCGTFPEAWQWPDQKHPHKPGCPALALQSA